MKYIWEVRDIRMGRRVQVSNRTETYLIGYDPRESGESNTTLVSLSDGMISRRMLSAEGMVAHLNEAGMRPVDVRGDDFEGLGRDP